VKGLGFSSMIEVLPGWPTLTFPEAFGTGVVVPTQALFEVFNVGSCVRHGRRRALGMLMQGARRFGL